MKKNNRLLYVMENDWDWIKQRPHFLAEELSKHFNVLVLYKRQTRRANLVQNTSAVRRRPIFQLPFLRFRVFRVLNSIAFAAQLNIWSILFAPRIIWYSHPFAHIISRKGIKTIYDCMDDHLTWDHTSQGEAKRETTENERRLLEKSDLTVFSSETLRVTVTGRAECSHNLVAPNAFGGSIIEQSDTPAAPHPDNIYRICYFGFIASHFDFSSLHYCLDRLTGVELHLYGPKEVDIPMHNQIIYHGALPHADLMKVAIEYDAFILPFHLTPLIRSVDPVKLYEYINLGKNVIAVRYRETEKFLDFAYLYSTREELLDLILRLSSTREMKYSNEQRIDFLRVNSWSERAKLIKDFINDIC